MREASTDEKTSKHRAKQGKTVILVPKRPLQLSKFKFLNSKFEFQASSCIADLKYYIHEASVEYGRRGGLHRRENSEKQRKTAKNSENSETAIFGAKKAVKSQILNFESLH